MYRLTFALLLALSIPAKAETPPIWLDLQPGTYAVGFKELTDSRLPVAFWYPARRSGEPMTFASYVHDARAFREFLSGTGLSSASIDSLMQAPVFATRNAPPVHERFPIILIAHGNGEDTMDQAVLAEYLASHGFVVAGTPSPMLAHPMTDQSQIAEFAERQATDLLDATKLLEKRERIRSDCMTIVGHSFGARAAILMAMKSSKIRLIVSLDGGIGTAMGITSLQTAPSWRGDTALPPIVHFYERLDPFMAPDFTFLHGLNAEALTLIATQSMHHVHFTTYGFASAINPELAKVTKAGDSVRPNVVDVATTVLRLAQTTSRCPRPAARKRGR